MYADKISIDFSDSYVLLKMYLKHIQTLIYLDSFIFNQEFRVTLRMIVNDELSKKQSASFLLRWLLTALTKQQFIQSSCQSRRGSRGR